MASKELWNCLALELVDRETYTSSSLGNNSSTVIRLFTLDGRIMIAEVKAKKSLASLLCSKIWIYYLCFWDMEEVPFSSNLYPTQYSGMNSSLIILIMFSQTTLAHSHLFSLLLPSALTCPSHFSLYSYTVLFFLFNIILYKSSPKNAQYILNFAYIMDWILLRYYMSAILIPLI